MPTLKQILDTRFGGVIASGCHTESYGKASAHELLSVKKGIPFTDQPDKVRCLDFRPINEMCVPDELRTKWMLRMLKSYQCSYDWSAERQKRVLERIIMSTIKELISGLRGLPKELVAECKAVKTPNEARSVAIHAIFAASCERASFAASCAADAVDYVDDPHYINIPYYYYTNIPYGVSQIARAAANATGIRSAATSDAFVKTCKLWLEAAKD